MWDIHGNSLKKGHCEVHPHVAEEYPCHMCIEQQYVAHIHQTASQIVDYEAPLEEKFYQVRSMAALSADQYTVNLLGHIHEDVEKMLAERDELAAKVKRQAKQLTDHQEAFSKLKDQKQAAERMAYSRKEMIKDLRKLVGKLQKKVK